MKFLLSVLCTLLLFGNEGDGQTKRLRVPLHFPLSSFDDISTNTRVSLDTDTCLPCYQGIPKNLKEAVVKTYSFDYTNDIYQMYKAKKLSDSMFYKLEKMYSLNKVDYWPAKVNSTMKILYGRDLNDSAVYIFDSNNDLNFKGERVYLKKQLQQIIKIKITNIEAVINGNLVKETVFVNIDFDGCAETFDDPLQQKWKLCCLVKRDKVGYIKLKNYNRYIVASNDIYYSFKYYSKGTRVYLLESLSKTPLTKFIPYQVGDTIYTSNATINVQSIDTSGKFIDFALTEIKTQKQFGFNEGDFVKPASFTNYFDTSSLRLDDFTGKYIFLDFWGTWCIPCKTVNPEVLRLKRDVEKASTTNFIAFLNIAWESNGQNASYREQVKKYYPAWKNVLEFQDQKAGLVNQLHIDGFPTFILISPSGRILLRKTGSDAFGRFSERVKAIIKEGIQKEAKAAYNKSG